LVVGVIVVALVAAIVLFAATRGGGGGSKPATVVDVKTLKSAEQQYCKKHGHYGTQFDLRSAGLIAETSQTLDVVLSTGGSCGSGSQAASAYGIAKADANLNIGVPSDTFTFSNPNTMNIGMFPYNANIFETLYRMTPTFQIEPWLALSTDRIPNNNSNYPASAETFRVHLRHGVHFHDGHELQSADVVWSMKRLATGSATNALKIGPLSTVAVPGDPYAVDITPTVTNELLLDQLVHPSVAPILADGTQPAASPTNITADGTGAYKFASYTQNSQLVVTRNDDYWGGSDPAYPRPILKTLTFKFYPDSNARVLALKAGDIDLMYDIPKDSLAAVANTQGLKTAVAPPAASEVLWLNSYGFNPQFTLLKDVNVRKALAMSIDRQSIVNSVWPAGAEVASTVTPAALLGQYSSDVKGQAYNPTAAKNLLDENGWTCGGGMAGQHTACSSGEVRQKGGVSLKLLMVNGFTPIDLRQPSDTIIQSELQAVGFGVTLHLVADQNEYNNALTAGAADIFMERISQNDASPVFFGNGFFYGGTNFNPATGGLYNKLVWGGPTFDSLLDKARVATDPAMTQNYTAQAMHEAVDNQVTVVQIAAVNWLFGMKSNVDGFLKTSARHVRWAPVYIAAS
jgi:peptide/nickel transport system substrate-binding protein